MAHFARLDENNVIIETVYVGNQDILDSNGNESEEIGQNICRGLRGTSNCIWKQTSFSNSFRCRYAGPGMVYDEEYDVFYHQKPYPSWILNTQDFVWEPPIPEPELTEEEIKTESYYIWVENSTSQMWVLVTPEPKVLEENIGD
jgi:hypothetical protein